MVDNKIVGTSTIAILFILAFFANGGGEVHSFTGDQHCKGLDFTVEGDVCVIIIDVTFKEELEVPVNYDPNTRSELLATYPAIKEARFYREWGQVWRLINLTEPCQSSWCGYSSSNQNFSVKFRKGQRIKLKFEVVKFNPTDTIKWSAFSGEIDPTLFGVKASAKVLNPDTRIEDVFVNYTIATRRVYDQYNITHINGTIEFLDNLSSWTYVNITALKMVDKKIMYKGSEFNQSLLNLFCTDLGICDSNRQDGNGDGICQAGESCCDLETMECDGFLSDSYVKKIKIKGIDDIKVKVKTK